MTPNLPGFRGWRRNEGIKQLINLRCKGKGKVSGIRCRVSGAVHGLRDTGYGGTRCLVADIGVGRPGESRGQGDGRLARERHQW